MFCWMYSYAVNPTIEPLHTFGRWPNAGKLRRLFSAISFNNIYYIVRKAESKTKAEKVLKLLRGTFDSVAPDAKIINQAIDSACDDFEDAIQFHSAIRAGAHVLITRNPHDFPQLGVSIATPEEFLKIWADRLSECP